MPGSESTRERIGQGPIGRFAPGSELARERKGCESKPTMGKIIYRPKIIIIISLIIIIRFVKRQNVKRLPWR